MKGRPVLRLGFGNFLVGLRRKFGKMLETWGWGNPAEVLSLSPHNFRLGLVKKTNQSLVEIFLARFA